MKYLKKYKDVDYDRITYYSINIKSKDKSIIWSSPVGSLKEIINLYFELKKEEEVKIKKDKDYIPRNYRLCYTYDIRGEDNFKEFTEKQIKELELQNNIDKYNL